MDLGLTISVILAVVCIVCLLFRSSKCKHCRKKIGRYAYRDIGTGEDFCSTKCCTNHRRYGAKLYYEL